MADAALTLAGAELFSGRPVLDAGCGTGWWLAELAARGIAPKCLHGADVDPQRVAAAAARVPGADVQVVDAAHLPYADSTFCAVTLFTVLSSLPAPLGRSVLAEVRRVLVSGGILLVWEPRIWTPNRATRLVRPVEITAVFGTPVGQRSLTLFAPLARRLPRRAYAPLARIPALHTHRLLLARAQGRRAAAA